MMKQPSEPKKSADRALAGDDQLFREGAKPKIAETRTPTYAIGFELYENGISRALTSFSTPTTLWSTES